MNLFTFYLWVYIWIMGLVVWTEASRCEICPVDTFCFQEQNFSCPMFSSSRQGSKNASACICHIGYFAISNHSCVPCPKGSFCPGDERTHYCPQFSTTVTPLPSSLNDCICVPGYYRNSSGVCTQCPVDTFKRETSDNICTACTPNSVLRFEGSDSDACECIPGYFNSSSRCILCKNGTYAPNYNSQECLSCPENFFRQNYTACTPCPHNSHSRAQSNSVIDCKCNVGYHGLSGKCQACPAGQYQDGSSPSTCQNCVPGKYSNASAETCTECPAHTFTIRSTSNSSADCVCNAGYGRKSNSESCTACAPGTFKSTLSNDECKVCPDDQYTLNRSANVDCRQCAVHMEPIEHSCQCIPGYELLQAGCSKCVPGQFKNTTSNASCMLCAANTFESHATKCLECPPNSHAPAGSTGCFCNVGFEMLHRDQTEPVLHILAGKINPQNDASIDGVGTNAVMAPQFLASWAPPDGSGEVILFSERGGERLYLRQIDVSTAEVSTLCSLSPPGHSDQGNPTIIKVGLDGTTLYVVDVEYKSISTIDMTGSANTWATERWVGAYQNTGTDEDDGEGTNAYFHKILAIDFVPDGSAMIVVERDSQVSDPEDGVRVKIRRVALDTGLVTTIGLVVTHATERTLMQVPTSSPTGMSIAPDGASIFLTEGPANRIWQIDISSVQKTEAPPVFIGGDGGVCKYENSGPDGSQHGTCDIIATLVAEYANLANPMSLDLSPQQTNLLIAEDFASKSVFRWLNLQTHKLTTLAPPGDVDNHIWHAIYSLDGTKIYVAEGWTIRYISINITQECIGCVAGKYKATANNEPCQSCVPGKYSLGGLGYCTACPNNTFQSEFASSICDPCPNNSRSTIASSDILDCLCVSGYERVLSDIMTCLPCSDTEYFDEETKKCTPCPFGKHSPSAHKIGQSSCEFCPPNTVRNTIDASCEACFPHSQASADHTLCLCNAGFMKPTIGDVCAGCPSGTFKTEQMSSNVAARCEHCPRGFSSRENSTQVSDCFACDVAKYTVSVRRTDLDVSARKCSPCSVSDLEGWSSPEASHLFSNCTCKPGFTGLTCERCGPATYKNFSGSGSCLSCPPGYISTDTERSSFEKACKPCNHSTFYGSPESCQKCHDNSVSPPASVSADACVCIEGYYRQGSQCLKCPAGHIKTTQSDEACSKCTGATFRSFDSENVCQECRANSRPSDVGDNFQASDCLCEEGYELLNSVCSPCPKGTFKQHLNNSACEICKGQAFYEESEPPFVLDRCTICPLHSEVRGNRFGVSSCFCTSGFRRVNAVTCAKASAETFVQPIIVTIKMFLDLPRLSEFVQTQIVATLMTKYNVQAGDIHIKIISTESRRLLQQITQLEITIVNIPSVDDTTLIDALHNDSKAFNCSEYVQNISCSGSFLVSGGVESCPTFSSSVAGASNISQCLCNAGYYEDNSTCHKCPSNAYCPGGSNFVLCPLNASSLDAQLAVNISDCTCAGGLFLQNDHCMPCESGSFCSDNVMSSCPPNSHSLPSATSTADCVCNTGFRMEGQNCQKCLDNEYCDGVGPAVSCAAGALAFDGLMCTCPDGHHCNNITQCSADKTCTECDNNTFCAGNIEFSCPSNSVAPVRSSSVKDCVCIPGYYRQGNQCVECDLNSYCINETKYACGDYDPNLVTLERGRHARSQCLCRETFFRLYNDDICKQCPLNYYCPTEDLLKLPNVVSCITNAYTLQASSKLSDCQCDAGTKLTATDNIMQCLACEPGERCLNGKVVEFQCQIAKRTPRADHSACVCMAGFYETTLGQCVVCPAGHVKPAIGNHECTACPSNTVPINFTHCTACAESKEANAGAPKCTCIAPLVETPAGCSPCQDNTFFDADTHTCKDCPANSSIVDPDDRLGVQACRCFAGHTPRYNASGCVPCPGGQYEQHGICYSCGSGATSEPASTSPDSCICSNSSCQSMAWSRDCIGVCAQDGSACEACPRGFYKADLSRNVAGSSLHVGVGLGSRCVPCAIGYYQPLEAQTSCQACPINRTTHDIGTSNLTECICKAGYEPTDSVKCRPCSLGHFKSDPGNHACSPCVLGSFADVTGALVCHTCQNSSNISNAYVTYEMASTSVDSCTCDLGYFLNLSAMMCMTCVPGTFKSTRGSISCTYCGSAGLLHMYGKQETGAISSDHCVNCPEHSGYDDVGPSYVMSSVEKCLCFAGYSTFHNISGCVVCDDFHVKLGYSNEKCTLCQPGKYYVDAHTDCMQCALLDADDNYHSFLYNSINGSFTWGTQISDCTCNYGFYVSGNQCRECDAGTYRDSFAYSECRPCALNTYQHNTGKSSCLACPSNSFTISNQSQSINDCMCDVGYAFDVPECVACAAGKFKNSSDHPNIDRGECDLCINGKFSTTSSSASCTPCGTNMHSEEPRDDISTCKCNTGYAGNPCVECTIGFYTQEGPCQQCPAGKTTILNASGTISDCVCLPGYGTAEPTPSTFTVTSWTTNPERILVMDVPFVLTVGQEVVVDWTATASSNHPFGLSTSSDYWATPLSTVVTQSFDDFNYKTTLLLHSLDTPLFYMCRYGHNFKGVSVQMFSDTASCDICEDGFYSTGFENTPCTHCGFGGVTYPERGATTFDACMCNHALGLFETPSVYTSIDVETILDVSLAEFDNNAQKDFEIALADTAEVPASQVQIVDVQESARRRRLLQASISVTSEIKTINPDAMDDLMTPERLKSKMLKRPRFKKNVLKWTHGITAGKLTSKRHKPTSAKASASGIDPCPFDPTTNLARSCGADSTEPCQTSGPAFGDQHNSRSVDGERYSRKSFQSIWDINAHLTIDLHDSFIVDRVDLYWPFYTAMMTGVRVAVGDNAEWRCTAEWYANKHHSLQKVEAECSDNTQLECWPDMPLVEGVAVNPGNYEADRPPVQCNAGGVRGRYIHIYRNYVEALKPLWEIHGVFQYVGVNEVEVYTCGATLTATV